MRVIRHDSVLQHLRERGRAENRGGLKRRRRLTCYVREKGKNWMERQKKTMLRTSCLAVVPQLAVDSNVPGALLSRAQSSWSDDRWSTIDDYSSPNNARLVAHGTWRPTISPGEISACFDNGALLGYCKILRFIRQRQSSRARWKIVSNVFATGRPKGTGIKKKTITTTISDPLCVSRSNDYFRSTRRKRLREHFGRPFVSQPKSFPVKGFVRKQWPARPASGTKKNRISLQDRFVFEKRVEKYGPQLLIAFLNSVTT